jgi:flagellar protein FliL
MSVTEAPAELPAPEEGSKKSRSLLKLIAAMLLLTLVAAGMGGGLGIKLADQVEDAVKAKESAEEKPAALLNYTGPTHLKLLAPIVTNLAEPRDTWIRLEASIVFDDEAIASDDVLAGQITEDFLAYLRTVGLSQVDGPSGLQHLREDLTDRARTRSDGRVREVVIQTLVFQ